jgi:hypothetical protein
MATRTLVEDLRLGGLAFGQGMAETASTRAIGSVRQAPALLVRKARWKNGAPGICPRRRAIMISPRQPFG